MKLAARCLDAGVFMKCRIYDRICLKTTRELCKKEENAMDIDSLVECVLLRRHFKKCIEAKDYELVKPANDPISYEIAIHDEVLCKCHMSKPFMWRMDAESDMHAMCRKLIQHNLKILDSKVVYCGDNRCNYKYQIFWQNNIEKKIDLAKKMDLDYLDMYLKKFL